MGLAPDVYGEGLRIPPYRLARAGEIVEDVMRLILANVRGNLPSVTATSSPDGSLKTGESRGCWKIVARRGVAEAEPSMPDT